MISKDGIDGEGCGLLQLLLGVLAEFIEVSFGVFVSLDRVVVTVVSAVDLRFKS